MRCSQQSRAAGLPLGATAGWYPTILAFELLGPWTPRLVGSRACGPELDAALQRVEREAKGLRLLALEPHSEAAGKGVGDDAVRVLRFAADPAPVAAYAATEFVVPRAQLPALLEALAFGQAEPFGQVPREAGTRDLMVCTHGGRDACCGKMGYPLFAAIRAAAPQGTRAWRCSHLGGHRFAPTVLDLPSGRVFGRLDQAGDAALLLGPPQQLAAQSTRTYRGRSLLPEALQLAERELWSQYGAAFEGARLSWRSRPTAEGAEAGPWAVELRAQLAGGGEVVAAGTAARSPVPVGGVAASCGRDLEDEHPWTFAPGS